MPRNVPKSTRQMRSTSWRSLSRAPPMRISMLRSYHGPVEARYPLSNPTSLPTV
jgi:hypothetical protein